MKFDMHCHTKEGSIDAKVSIEAYIKELRTKGFDGMLVTDHNSFKGYQKWKESHSGRGWESCFAVLKGVEYDTRDGGHMIAVLPDGVSCRLLELRGLSVAELEKIVHFMGGILGPAHPYGTGFFALMNNYWVKRHQNIIEKFDFIETINSCTQKYSNYQARQLAEKYKKPQIAGSDAHKKHIIGTAYTVFNEKIQCNNDLIRAVKENRQMYVDGSLNDNYLKRENVILKFMGIAGYWLYNQIGALWYTFARMKEKKNYQ